MFKFYTFCAMLILFVGMGVNAQDTLKHYDIFGSEGVYAIYESQVQPFTNNWGYRYGHGARGVNEMAEKYSVSQEENVLGILVLFDGFSGANTDATAWVAVYDQVAASAERPGAPEEEPMYKKNVAISDFNVGLTSPTIVMFDEEVKVSDSFYVAWGVPTYPFNKSSPNFTPSNDTVGMYTTYTRSEDPDSNVYWKNAIRFSGGAWENTEFIVYDRLNFCISPIIGAFQDTTSDTMSIAEHSLNRHVQVKSLYPNPVQNELTIQLSATKPMIAGFSIFTTDGRLVSRRQLRIESGEQQIRIDDLQALEAGNYVAVIATREGMLSYMLRKQ